MVTLRADYLTLLKLPQDSFCVCKAAYNFKKEKTCSSRPLNARNPHEFHASKPPRTFLFFSLARPQHRGAFAVVVI